MHIIKLNKEPEECAHEVERILRSGEIVISPTDTVYGILGNAESEQAIQRMFALKRRPKEKPFPIFVKDIAMARRYAYISDAKARFLEKIWPGQITVLFDHKEKLPLLLTGGSEKIGIRIPKYHFLQDVLLRCDFPIAQTSANISGEPPARNVDEIKNYFARRHFGHTSSKYLDSSNVQKIHTQNGAKFMDSKIQPAFVIDGGALEGKSSTIIDLTRTQPILVRSGLMSKDMLDDLLHSMLP